MTRLAAILKMGAILKKYAKFRVAHRPNLKNTILGTTMRNLLLVSPFARLLHYPLDYLETSAVAVTHVVYDLL